MGMIISIIILLLLLVIIIIIINNSRRCTDLPHITFLLRHFPSSALA